MTAAVRTPTEQVAELADGFGRWPVRVLGHRADGMVVVQYVRASGEPGGICSVPSSMLADRPAPPPAREFDQATRTAQTGPGRTAAQFAVLDALVTAGENGLIDDDYQELIGLIPTSAGKRRVEIERRGLAAKHGTTRPTRTGAYATVYIATRAGRVAHRHYRQIIREVT